MRFRSGFYLSYISGYLILVLGSAQVPGLAQNLGFGRLTRQDGLSQASVRTICQDGQGFLWMGTDSGLNRYDGKSIRVFMTEPEDPSSLGQSAVRKLMRDRRGRLWVGTLDGLERYDPACQCFTRYTPEQHGMVPGMVNALVEGPTGLIWVGHLPDGISALDPDTDQVQRYSLKPYFDNRQDEGGVTTLAFDPHGVLWAGTGRGGLYRLDPREEGQPEPVYSDYESFGEIGITAIKPDARGQLWVATRGLGVFSLDASSEVLIPLTLAGGRDVSDMELLDIIWEGHILWMGSASRGLFCFDRARDSLDHYRYAVADPKSIADNKVLSLYLDHGGLLWIGTNGGVSKLTPAGRGFTHYVYSAEGMGLSHNRIKGILEGQDGTVWVGTYGGGLNAVDRRKKKIKQYRPGNYDDGELPSRMVSSLAEIGETIWVGTYSHGLFGLSKASGRFTSYPNLDDVQNDGLLIRALMAAADGKLWVGSSGLDLFDPQTGDFTPIGKAAKSNEPRYSPVLSIQPGGNGRLWVTTYSRGLFHFDPGSGRFIRYSHDEEGDKGLPTDNLYSAIQARDGHVWIGTVDQGLLRLAPESGEIQAYNRSAGLPDHVVYGIVEDSRGYLWLSTNNGLVRFDPKGLEVRIYDSSDGLPNLEFNAGAFTSLKSGEVAFGGVSGMTILDPSRLILEQSKPPVLVFTDFWKMNQRVRSGPHISVQEKVVVAARDYLVGFEFAALDFANPQTNRYAYKLDGLDDQWQEIGNRNLVHFTNLSSGHYTFRVKAANNEGVWTERPLALKIEVRAPFWRTPSAYLFYGLLLLTIVLFFVLSQERTARLLARRVEERTHELNQKNQALSASYGELEMLESMIKSINREVPIDRVVQSLVDQALKLLPGADIGGFLKLNGTRDAYNITALSGYSQIPVSDIPKQELLTSLRARDRISEGVYHFEGLRELMKTYGLRRPASGIVMTLTLEANVEGVLCLVSTTNAEAFSPGDFRKIARLREHALAAIAKARMIERLAEAQDDLARMAHAAGMSELATNLAHEQGNLLNSIRTTAQLIKEFNEPAEALRLLARSQTLLSQNRRSLATLDNGAKLVLVPELLGRICQSLKGRERKLAELITELNSKTDGAVAHLLNLDNHTQAGQRLVEEVDLNQFLEATLDMEGFQLLTGKIVVEKELSELPALRLETSKLRRVIVYLLRNALEAVEAGGEEKEGRLLCRTGMLDGQAVLEISDNGDGLPEQPLEALFSYGFSTREAHHGFGLHYCANAVREMGGELKLIRENPPMSTTARISFPLPNN